jgi:hypothetical protein
MPHHHTYFPALRSAGAICLYIFLEELHHQLKHMQGGRVRLGYATRKNLSQHIPLLFFVSRHLGFGFLLSSGGSGAVDSVVFLRLRALSFSLY